MPENYCVVVLGDSITYGMWDLNGGWPMRLRASFDSPGMPVPNNFALIYNLGIPVETSTQLLRRAT